MTDLVTPGEVGAEIDNTSAGNAWAKSSVGGWVVDGVDLAGIYSALDETVLNDFNYASSSGLDVTIDPGEAYVGGWLCRDTQTTVTLPASSTTTVYLGYDASAILGDTEAPSDSENVIIGLDGDFSDEDPRIPIREFTTDSTAVTGNTDRRLLKQPVSVNHSSNETVVSTGLTVEDDAKVGTGTAGQLRIVNSGATTPAEWWWQVRDDGRMQLRRFDPNTRSEVIDVSSDTDARVSLRDTIELARVGVTIPDGPLTVQDDVTVTGNIVSPTLTEQTTLSGDSRVDFEFSGDPGTVYLSSFHDDTNRIGNRTIGIAGSNTAAPNVEFESTTGDALFQGNVDIEGSQPVVSTQSAWDGSEVTIDLGDGDTLRLTDE